MKLKPLNWKEQKDDHVLSRYHFTEATIVNLTISIDHISMDLRIYVGKKHDTHTKVDSIAQGKEIAEKFVLNYLSSFFEND